MKRLSSLGRRLWVLAFLFLLPSLLLAGIQDPRGYHSFSGNLTSRWGYQPSLTATGFSPAYAPVTIVPGAESQVLSLPAFSPAQSLVATNWAASNGGAGINGGSTATKTNRWTLVMDINPTTVSGTTWTSLLQTNPANSDDGEIFIRNDGSLFSAGTLAPAGTVTFNQWQRLAFVCDNNGTGGTLTVTAYRNGSPVGSIGAQEFDGRFALGSQFLLFADENNETTPGQVNALCYWTDARTPAEIAAMGGPAGTSPEIQWPSMPTPVSRPGLTGDFTFGSYTLSLPASGFLLGNGVLTLATGATVPGIPAYSLTGNHAFRLRSDGALVYTGGGVTISAATFVRFNNVLVSAGTISLNPSGATATNYRLHLPVGMSVGRLPGGATERWSRRMLALATLGSRPLSSGLSPSSGAQTLQASFFGLPSGDMSLALETRPVRYVVPSITWAPSTGAFLIPSTTQVGFDRFSERSTLIQWNLMPGVAGDVRPSNDDLFAFASSLGETIVDTNANGMATLRQGEQNFTAGAGGFLSHFPLVQVKWNSATGSRIRHAAGTLQSDSQLTDGLNDVFVFSRDPLGSACGIAAGAKALAYDPPGDWKITRDGGLHAAVNFTGTTAQRTIEWGAITSTTFAHRITTPLSSGAVMIPGNALPASQVPGVSIADRPAALLLSGNGNGIAPETTLERPGSATYYTGAADYPGLNVRIAVNGTHSATSQLAGSSVTYPLRNTSKYLLRPSGVTGVHDAVAQAVPPGQSYAIQTFLAGYPVGLSDLRLAFLDTENIQSGVNGAFSIPAPASLPDLAVNNLRFGPRGELLDARFVLPGEMTLGYWGCKITPHAMRFARPDTPCPSPGDASLVLGATVKLPALSDQPFTGNIGFKPNGHTVTASDNQEAGGEKITSRLRPPNAMSLKGPGTQSYPFTPTARGAWLNEYTGGTAPPGFVAIPGEMNVPFFLDLKVLVNARSSAGATADSSLTVVAGDSANFNFFAAADPDPGNLGTQPGLPGPRARRKLWDLIDLDLPLAWNDNLRRFKGGSIYKDLLLFRVDQKCSTLGPEVAEINFGASANSVSKTISAATLLDAVGADTKDLLAGITGPASGLVNDALASLKVTDDLGEAALEKLLGPALDGVSQTVAGTLYDTLAANYAAAGGNLAAFKSNAANNTAFTTAANGVAGQIGTLPGGAWRTEIQSRLNAAITTCQRLESLAQNSAHILSIAQSISAHATETPGNAPSVANLTQTLADLHASIVTLRSRLEEIRDGFNSGAVFTSLLANQLGSVSTWITPAVESLKTDWIAQIPDPLGTGYFTAARKTEFIAQFKQRVRANFLGSTTEQNLRQVVSEITTDALSRLRNSFDGIIDAANTAVQATNALPDPDVEMLGEFPDVFKGGKLTGYARINGESLKELRLDGELTLKVPDDMTLRAWFVMRDMDGSMPGDKALAAGGVKTEVTVGAAAPLTFLGQADAYASAELRVALGDSGPVGVAGSLDISGDIDFQSIKVSQLHFAVAVGAVDCYVGAKVAGELDTGYFIIGAEVAVFLGKTSRLEPIQKINPNVAGMISQLGLAAPDSTSPLYGAYVYAYGNFSVLSLLGIPPSCLLDIRLGGGQGNYIFYRPGNGALAGMQFTHTISGRVLCLVNIGGGIDGYLAGAYVQSPGDNRSASFSNLKAAGRLNAQLSGKVGISPFSYTWKKNFGFDVTLNPAASPKTSWSVHY